MLEHDFLLLDRSGSMGGSMWVEALNAINGYVKKLADENVNTGVTLAVFDSNEPFKVIRDRILPKTWHNVTSREVEPRGGTPLYDATAKLVSLAEAGAPWGQKYDRVSIVIMTDGEENSSQEYNAYTVKNLLDRCREKGWAITFLGANFDNARQAASLGGAYSTTINTTMKNYAGTMANMATKRAAYSHTGVATSMSWTPSEQAEAAEINITPTTTADENKTA